MGRQTAIVATETDERALLEFMRSVADIRILRRFAKTPDEMWISEFAPYDPQNSQYFIWNTAFPWNPPEVEQRDDGGYFCHHPTRAPVIEFKRTDWPQTLKLNSLVLTGRIYWERLHMALTPAELQYDLKAFDQWYAQVVRWVRKHGRQDPDERRTRYLLPDAWDRWQSRPQNKK